MKRTCEYCGHPIDTDTEVDVEVRVTEWKRGKGTVVSRKHYHPGHRPPS